MKTHQAINKDCKEKKEKCMMLILEQKNTYPNLHVFLVFVDV